MFLHISLLSCLASLLPSASAFAYPHSGGVSVSTTGVRKTCTVTANGGNISDVSNILHAFSECNNGGTIVFPEDQNYYIASKLNPVINDVQVEWRGIWTVSNLFSGSSMLC